jgi:hypothetical protein
MDERIQIYQRITGFTPSCFQQDLIESRIVNVSRWTEAVTWWMGNGYRAQSVLKVIEYYDQLMSGKDKFGQRTVKADPGRWEPIEYTPEPPCSFCGKEMCLQLHEDERRGEIAAYQTGMLQ